MEFEQLSDADLEKKLAKGDATQRAWAGVPFSERAKLLKKLASLFREEKAEIGKLISLEIGRPINASIAESEKCGWVCDYYADEAENMLSPEAFPEGLQGEVRFEPLGVIFAVMPWNYPFWQVMRFLSPALMAGNGGVMKHASNVPQSAAYLEEMVLRAGFPEGLFQNLFISIEQAAKVIDDERIAAVTLTGSVRAGSAVAERAGKNMKKVVLELGGSDPFIVLEDADVPEAAKVGALARLQNAGQSCIAAKRFLIHEKIYDEFLKLFKVEFEAYKMGDPFAEGTMIGPVVTEAAAAGLEEQVKKTLAMGAKALIGGKRKEGAGSFYEPTILVDVKKGMPAYSEELFGPVATVIKIQNDDEAVEIANDTEFGLSSSLWTKDIERAKKLAGKIRAGGVFINSMTKSDPRIPFGGIKKSGHGRELASFGIKEFVNVKVVSIANPAPQAPRPQEEAE